MPRKKRGVEEKTRPVGNGLAGRLADELRSSRPSGQPLIDEQEFPSGQVRVTVIWDEWDRLPLEDRTAVILRAYDLAEGRDYRDRLALVSGLTVPEAYSAGMLPFEVIPAIRRGDAVTHEQDIPIIVAGDDALDLLNDRLKRARGCFQLHGRERPSRRHTVRTSPPQAVLVDLRLDPCSLRRDHLRKRIAARPAAHLLGVLAQSEKPWPYPL